MRPTTSSHRKNILKEDTENYPIRVVEIKGMKGKPVVSAKPKTAPLKIHPEKSMKEAAIPKFLNPPLRTRTPQMENRLQARVENIKSSVVISKNMTISDAIAKKSLKLPDSLDKNPYGENFVPEVGVYANPRNFKYLPVQTLQAIPFAGGKTPKSEPFSFL
jgi:hypothetical protein